MVKLGELYRRLTKPDILILEYMVSSLRKYEYIPVENIVKKFMKIWNQKDIMARVKKLVELGFIERHPVTEAYKLKTLGLDCVAISRLVSDNVIKALGNPIGMGKESIIFSGISYDGNVVAVKFYRIGRRSFRHIARVRGYSTSAEGSTWLIRSIIAGEREREALSILNKHGIKGVPKLYGHALHAIVIEFIDGVNLYRINEIDNPLEIFNQIINIIENCYRYAGIVHGDLSEYNIMVQFNDAIKSYIIDWPQYLPTDDPRAINVLKKDVIQLIRFFNSRFKLEVQLDEVLKNILYS